MARLGFLCVEVCGVLEWRLAHQGQSDYKCRSRSVVRSEPVKQPIEEFPTLCKSEFAFALCRHRIIRNLYEAGGEMTKKA